MRKDCKFLSKPGKRSSFISHHFHMTLVKQRFLFYFYFLFFYFLFIFFFFFLFLFFYFFLFFIYFFIRFYSVSVAQQLWNAIAFHGTLQENIDVVE